MGSLDLKDAFYLISIHESDRKFSRFNFYGVLYQFTCLPFGLCTSPYVFTKIMKPVINALRVRGFISVIYLDDILCIGDTYDSCKQFRADKYTSEKFKLYYQLRKFYSRINQ